MTAIFRRSRCSRSSFLKVGFQAADDESWLWLSLIDVVRPVSEDRFFRPANLHPAAEKINYQKFLVRCLSHSTSPRQFPICRPPQEPPTKMPSRRNPNVPNSQRRKSSRAKVQKRNAINKITKNPRGTAVSNVMHPTSGPLAPLSGKKARKVEKARNHARQRALEEAMARDGEIVMTGEQSMRVHEVILV